MAAAESARIPRSFLIVVFAVAIVIGAIVWYLGSTGILGAGIP